MGVTLFVIHAAYVLDRDILKFFSLACVVLCNSSNGFAPIAITARNRPMVEQSASASVDVTDSQTEINHLLAQAARLRPSPRLEKKALHHEDKHWWS